AVADSWNALQIANDNGRAHLTECFEGPMYAPGFRVEGVHEPVVAADEHLARDDGRLGPGSRRRAGQGNGPLELQIGHLLGSDPGARRRLEPPPRFGIGTPAVPLRPGPWIVQRQ